MDSQHKPLLILGSLISRGHRYIRNRRIKRKTDDKEVIYWRCENRLCPGKMTTIRRVMEVSNVSNYTHAPDVYSCECSSEYSRCVAAIGVPSIGAWGGRASPVFFKTCRRAPPVFLKNNRLLDGPLKLITLL